MQCETNKYQSKVGGRSGVDVGLSSLFFVGPESVNGVERGIVGALEDPESLLLESFKIAEQLI